MTFNIMYTVCIFFLQIQRTLEKVTYSLFLVAAGDGKDSIATSMQMFDKFHKQLVIGVTCITNQANEVIISIQFNLCLIQLYLHVQYHIHNHVHYFNIKHKHILYVYLRTYTAFFFDFQVYKITLFPDTYETSQLLNLDRDNNSPDDYLVMLIHADADSQQ